MGMTERETYEIWENNVNSLSEIVNKESVDVVVDLLDKYNLPSYCIDIALCLAQRKKGSVTALCKKHHIARETFYRYRMNEGVLEIMKILTKRIYAKYIPNVMNVIKDKSLQGSVEAAKLFLGVNDLHQDEAPKNITNVQLNANDIDVFIGELRNKTI